MLSGNEFETNSYALTLSFFDDQIIIAQDDDDLSNMLR